VACLLLLRVRGETGVARNNKGIDHALPVRQQPGINCRRTDLDQPGGQEEAAVRDAVGPVVSVLFGTNTTAVVAASLPSELSSAHELVG
jgi:hypothetical protein